MTRGKEKSGMEPDYIRAHKHSFKNREEVLRSETCGCFYCRGIFLPNEITHWIDDDLTAMCPKCDIDSVIGSASGFPIEKPLLKVTEERWFSSKPRSNQGNG
jgi:hypothetical protein